MCTAENENMKVRIGTLLLLVDYLYLFLQIINCHGPTLLIALILARNIPQVFSLFIHSLV